MTWRFRLWISLVTIFVVAISNEGLLKQDNYAYNEGQNLALNKDVSVTTFCNSCGTFGTNAVDGDTDTYWRALSRDEYPMITVDLGEGVEWNKVVLHLNPIVIDGFVIEHSSDGQVWEEAYNFPFTPIATVQEVVIDPVDARYVRVGLTTSKPANPLIYELEVYMTDEEAMEPPASILAEVLLQDEERNYSFRDDIRLDIGSVHQFDVLGKMSDGSDADLSEANISYKSSDQNILTTDSNGQITVVGYGVAKFIATVELYPATLSFELFVVVENLAEDVIWNALWDHPDIVTEIGQPSVMQMGEPLPSMLVEAYADISLHGELLDSTGNVVAQISEQFQQEEVRTIEFAGMANVAGTYVFHGEIHTPGNDPIYDALYFTARDPAELSGGQSEIAFIGTDGKMQYVPDYKGNKILDFSNSGYMGGGVKLPDVQARITVEPGEGDDTSRIQDAIDQVSLMPIMEDGFRGAVVLERGTFEVGGTLRIEADGVVLRGKGSGEDGTILFATGTTRRDLLQIRGSSGPSINPNSGVEIVDMYVPVGARTFRVAAADGFAVGDTIMVRRDGNDQWIHAIDMDSIVEREDTVQWSPFAIDFDRVITAIDGDEITVDAPLANAIERRWGGGEIYLYTDSGRIEQVGVENLRVIVDFDPSVTATSSGVQYYADENKARTFVTLNNVKNAWVREIDAFHLEYALASVQSNAKWVTIQDTRNLEPVSLLTGSRRYAYNYDGQLALTQRVYSEGARHAFVVGARVPGPNVFLQSVSETDHAFSEPHHRWSVGGLYDNISGRIALQDRALYGTGHGWAGANYVAWNTEGDLMAQSPPTAQNYAIGHVGERLPGDWPNAGDPRPREDAYWESYGTHVQPQSLYLQQLKDRLGEAAVTNIEQTPVGGEALDTPQIDHLPVIEQIYINGIPLSEFTPEQYVYYYEMELGMEDVPYVTADSENPIVITQADDISKQAKIQVISSDDPDISLEYAITFIHPTLPDHLVYYPVVAVSASTHDGNVPENTLDDDLGTRWSAEGKQWIQFDLGTVQPVSTVLLAFYNGNQRKHFFDLEVSQDGEQWERVFQGESSGTTAEIEMFTFSEKHAKYIRYYGFGNSVNDWNSLTIAKVANYELEEVNLAMNGFVQLADDSTMIGVKTDKVHLQHHWHRNYEGELSGQGMLHTTPRGHKITLEAVDWLMHIPSSNSAVAQWRGMDATDRPFTIRVALRANQVSVIVWEGNSPQGEPLEVITSGKFQGNIQFE